MNKKERTEKIFLCIPLRPLKVRILSFSDIFPHMMDLWPIPLIYILEGEFQKFVTGLNIIIGIVQKV